MNASRAHQAHRAHQARRALSHGVGATLFVSGVGTGVGTGVATAGGGDAAIVLHDDDGWPTFCCDPGSGVTAAARTGSRGLLRVTDPPSGDTVLIVGALSIIGTQWISAVQGAGATRVDVVALRPAGVFVEQSDARDRPLAPHRVDLGDFFSGADDGTARLLAHLNRDHAEQLRQMVGGTGEVAYAYLAKPTPDGVLINWADRAGAQVTGLRFDSAASTSHEWSSLLRVLLTRRDQNADN